MTAAPVSAPLKSELFSIYSGHKRLQWLHELRQSAHSSETSERLSSSFPPLDRLAMWRLASVMIFSICSFDSLISSFTPSASCCPTFTCAEESVVTSEGGSSPRFEGHREAPGLRVTGETTWAARSRGAREPPYLFNRGVLEALPRGGHLLHELKARCVEPHRTATRLRIKRLRRLACVALRLKGQAELRRERSLRLLKRL